MLICVTGNMRLKRKRRVCICVSWMCLLRLWIFKFLFHSFYAILACTTNDKYFRFPSLYSIISVSGNNFFGGFVCFLPLFIFILHLNARALFISLSFSPTCTRALFGLRLRMCATEAPSLVIHTFFLHRKLKKFGSNFTSVNVAIIFETCCPNMRHHWTNRPLFFFIFENVTFSPNGHCIFKSYFEHTFFFSLSSISHFLHLLHWQTAIFCVIRSEWNLEWCEDCCIFIIYICIYIGPYDKIYIFVKVNRIWI